MTTISWSTVIDTSSITDTTRKSQIETVLSQLEATPEGQVFFDRISIASGQIKMGNSDGNGNSYTPTAMPREINIDWDFLETTKYKKEDGTYDYWTLNRAVVHEVIHAADYHYDPALSDGLKDEELTTVKITNEYMNKYYSETSGRYGYNDPGDALTDQPNQAVVVYNSTNPNPDYEYSGWFEDDMLDLLSDPNNNQSWLDGLRDYMFGEPNDGSLEPLRLYDNIQDGVYTSSPDVRELPPWAQAILDAFEAAKNIISPLVLDIDGDGIELAALNGPGSVYWDIDLDDFAESSGWVAGGDGLLAIDLDSDGVINDHSELFGDQTGSPNGFAALSAYDTNSDTAITSADTQWGDLLVWIDTNANGYSESDELHTLDDLGITSISLNYTSASYTVSGNEIKQESSFVINGQTRDIVDAWFAYDNVNTAYAEDYTLDLRTLFLPSLRGYGKLPDLHIAMSMDETLLDMVEVVATADATTLLSTAFDLEGKVTDIMYRWAEVDGIDPASRGPYIDARLLEFLETFLDDKYQGYGQIDNDPSGVSQADALEDIFEDALSAITERLLIQSAAAKDLFDTVPSYDLASDMMEAYSSSVDLELGTINGDTINGTAGNDYILGFEGNDTLHGDEGNDILEGGPGNDTLYGDEGDDRYVFGADFGNDYLYENASEGSDVIAFTDGITRADLDIWADSSGKLYFGLDGTSYSQLYVHNNSFSSSTGSNIHNLVERVEFSDGDFIDLTQGLYINDTDTGRTMKLGAGNDEVYGNGGDDKIYTYGGNDILAGGAGDDNLYGGAGDDTYLFGLGFGSDSVTENASEGADTIQFVDGITRADLDIWATSSGHLYFGLDGATYSQFYIYNNSFSNNTGSNIHNLVERVEFSDGDFIDLSQGLYINDTDVGRTIKLGAGDDEAYGNGGNDNIYTYAGNDTVHGGDGADSIFAGDDNDILYGGDGIDHLYGQGGADTYAYDQLFTAVDVIHGFSTAEGDKLDLADLISTYDPVSDAITDFVWMVTAGSNTDIYVDQDGTGTTDVWTKIATMQSVTGLTDEAALEANGTLITV